MMKKHLIFIVRLLSVLALLISCTTTPHTNNFRVFPLWNLSRQGADIQPAWFTYSGRSPPNSPCLALVKSCGISTVSAKYSTIKKYWYCKLIQSRTLSVFLGYYLYILKSHIVLISPAIVFWKLYIRYTKPALWLNCEFRLIHPFCKYAPKNDRLSEQIYYKFSWLAIIDLGHEM